MTCAGDEKPIFIPLRAEWFRQFEAGAKSTEYRAYGKRWNEHVCRAGRAVTLSYGYSGPRLARAVSGFRILPRSEAPPEARDIYPFAMFIAAIDLVRA